MTHGLPVMCRLCIAMLLMFSLSPAMAASYLDEDAETIILPGVSVPQVSDFTVEGRLAAAEERIILLLISQVHCPYCVLIKEEIIHPMIRGEDFVGQLLIRELIIDVSGTIKDFDGKSIDAMEFARQYDSTFTPTLLFLDAKGNELTERVVGINTLELYYAYVDSAIRKALAAMKN